MKTINQIRTIRILDRMLNRLSFIKDEIENLQVYGLFINENTRIESAIIGNELDCQKINNKQLEQLFLELRSVFVNYFDNFKSETETNKLNTIYNACLQSVLDLYYATEKLNLIYE